MFPDLRLLISATVATFFLAATGGLYASLRITQDQIAARTDGRNAIDDSPIMRISAAWPLPEPGRAAALRELAVIAKHSSVIPTELPVDRNENIPVTAETEMPNDAERRFNSAALKEDATPDAPGSTGLAVPPDPGVLNQIDHPDIQGNVVDAPGFGSSNTGAEKETRKSAKQSLQGSKKKSSRTAQRRKRIVHPVPHPLDPVASGYPLYLTVPVTN